MNQAHDATTPLRTEDELVLEHLGLARRLAARYASRGVELDDLVQVANLALIKAARGFKPERGAFPPFATATILGEIKKHFRDSSWTVRPPRRIQELQAQIVSATADLLPFKPSGWEAMALPMPVWTISSSRPMSSKGEILRGSLASM